MRAGEPPLPPATRPLPRRTELAGLEIRVPQHEAETEHLPLQRTWIFVLSLKLTT